MTPTIRDVYGASLARYGLLDERIVVLDADVSASTRTGTFAQSCPERFFNVGIAEANMAAMAAGLASEGKIPFINTFAVFMTTLGALSARTFAGYGRLNIKFMGAYGGISDAYDGATHHSVEDLAIMRAIPGIQVLVASDAVLTDWLVRNAIAVNAPMYIRLSRDAMPPLYPEGESFTLGQGKVLRQGTDVTVMTCGILGSIALQAADILALDGFSVRVVDHFTVKPIDKDLVRRCARETQAIVTAEEHSVVGGLGSAVAEVLVRDGLNVPLEMAGIPDCYTQSGSYAALMAAYGLDAAALAVRIRSVLARAR